jgi:hypothetical protein
VSRRTHTRAAGTMVLSVLLAAVSAGATPVAGNGRLAPAAMPQQRSADLAPALGADGTFRGAAGVAGTVDARAWSLVSDLAKAEPPRFAPAASDGTRPPAGGYWSALGSNGAGNGALDDAMVEAVAVSGNDVYVGGNFRNVAGIPEADHVARWDGTAWSALGSNGAGDGAIADPTGYIEVFALAVSGTDLFVGGNFTNVAGIPEADHVAKWDGTAWSSLGSDGAGDGAINDTVLALAVSATDLYAGGNFYDAGGVDAADHVAAWPLSGVSWRALGSVGALDGGVLGLAVSGEDLYLVGYFTNAGGIPEADYVAKWNAGAWSALGSNGAGDGAIARGGVHVFYVGSLVAAGTDVYVGGEFANVAGIPEADDVAKWNGSAWSALGSNGAGDGAIPLDTVYSLAVSGTDLYVGGNFTVAGIPDAQGVARWSGSAWSALGPNPFAGGGLVRALAVSSSGIYAGGSLNDVARIPEADFIAKWTVDTIAPDTIITGGPPSPVASTSARFSFTSTQPGSTFECSLNGASYRACTSPIDYSGFLEGAHTFAVQATDPAGNVDASPASRTWTVDTIAPETTITAGPSGAVSNLSATFSFSASEPGSTFQCSLDGAVFTWACSSPKVYLALSQGAHDFHVRAIDPAGNIDATPASRDWTVDTTAPDTHIDGGPGRVRASDSATFRFSSTEPRSTFLCALDSAKPSHCSSPAVYGSLGLGSHKFAVSAIDAAGNVDPTPANRTWTQTVIRQPDGRIRLGNSGPFVGDDIYDASGLGQRKTGSAAPGQTITFEVSVQNDGTGVDTFKVKATGTAVTGYRVRYLDGITDVTPDVLAGSYRTPLLAVGASHSLRVTVKVRPSAAVGSSVRRLVTITSGADPTKRDAVKLKVERT